MSAVPAPRDAETTLALAHALRTPLTALALGLGLLDDNVLGALNEGQQEVVRTLVGEVSRLTLLVERHLDTELLGAYTGPLERVRVDLGELTRRAGAPIVRQAKSRGVRVVFDLPAGLGVVADPVKLGWVVVSLMGNALRYSPAGAVIDVELRAVTPDGGDGREVELGVRDRGPGLTPEVEARAFDRDGGPGLLLAREIVEAHGGRIAVRTAPGRGSTFTIALLEAPGPADDGVEPR